MATLSTEPDTSASQSEILHFIKSTFGKLEGKLSLFAHSHSPGPYLAINSYFKHDLLTYCYAVRLFNAV